MGVAAMLTVANFRPGTNVARAGVDRPGDHRTIDGTSTLAPNTVTPNTSHAR